MENKFNEDDKKKLVEFLNMIAQKASFQLDTKEIISYYKLLSFMQQELLPKLDANIMEVVAVHEDSSEEDKGE